MAECYRTTIAGFDIVLRQDTRGSFRVDYGLQHGTFTTYDRAAHELGAAIMHALACEGRLDIHPETR